MANPRTNTPNNTTAETDARLDLEAQFVALLKAIRRIAMYIPYLTALALLKNQVKASQGEISMWVFCGSKFGGIDGYHNPQLYGSDEAPPIFQFHPGATSDFDYLPQLMHCYFKRQDVETFNPANRYWTYTQLLGSWGSRCTKDEAVALIAAKVATGELQSRHPLTGVTKGTLPTSLSEDGFPPLEQGLFLMSEIEKIGVACLPPLSPSSVGHSSDDVTEPFPHQADFGNSCDVFRAMRHLDASEVTIAFVGDKSESGLAANSMLEISARGEKKRIALAELDLVDRRGGTLNRQAAVLLGMARSSNLPHSGRNSRTVTRLRDVFRNHLGLRNDPFESYRRGIGWQPRFKITDMRGAADARAKREGELRAVPYDDEALLKRNRTSDNGQHDSGDKDDAADTWLRTNDPESPASQIGFCHDKCHGVNWSKGRTLLGFARNGVTCHA